MTTILVSSTRESTGKTAIALALASIADEAGHDVGYMKPKGIRIESTVGKTRDKDPDLAREVLGLDADMAQLEPMIYSRMFAQEAIRGREDPAELRERVAEQYETLAADCDVMILEGSNRPQTGKIIDLTDPDVADLLDAEAVLVSEYTDPRDLDEVIAGAEAFGDRLSGVLFNGVEGNNIEELSEEAFPFLDGRSIRTLGAIPRDERLAGVTVEELAQSLGADLLTPDVPLDGRIERLLVGAMGQSAALEHFRRTRNCAVITGGDRSDIQTTALESSGVNCLILTGGYRPSKAILGTASKRSVPVLSVKSNTRVTIDRVEDELRAGRTQGATAVEHMAELLEESFEIDDVLGLE
jgi:BioD-like phosphotransacetylase family protein